MSTQIVASGASVVMARASLTPADKAVLAMTSIEYLALANPDDADGALSAICSPVSTTSTFSSIWSSHSRRPSSSSDTSQDTHNDASSDEASAGEAAVKHVLEADQAAQPAAYDYVPVVPEALAVGACIVRCDPDTSRPAVLLVRPKETGTWTSSVAGGKATSYHQHSTPGLWLLPQSTTSTEDFSISAALERTVRQQTGLAVTRVVATLHDTRHHLHRLQDIQALSLQTHDHKTQPDSHEESRDGDVVGDDEQAGGTSGLGISTLDELVRMIDLSCAGAAASLAAADAARRIRNVSPSTIADSCPVCDLMPPGPVTSSSSRRQVRRVRVPQRQKSHFGPTDNDMSDACSTTSVGEGGESSGGGGGYSSNSDESTCRLLHNEVHPETKRRFIRQRDDAGSNTDDHGTKELGPLRNARAVARPASGNYMALPQEDASNGLDVDDDDGSSGAGSGSGSGSRNSATRLDSDSDSASDDVKDISVEHARTFRECLQLNYIVLVADNADNAATAAAAAAVEDTNKNHDDVAEVALVTERDLDERRMSPQTRDLVRQGLIWAREHFAHPAPGKPSRQLMQSKRDEDAKDSRDGREGSAMPAPLRALRKHSITKRIAKS
ncbi:uncharacterized protein B0I36DRAFT_24669 [Microdochium trichocladiopsis]|uniref:Uncharacterized protein n=1 Tax=Microdochium trichocladiopsis TaxID=1682393 RepID=A0A9P8YJT3_9PEZI|nr:uncharacterized protein B0I36DRAFT_24669 [Microdochium trichocladiopsis]KAH7041585.1 hypothetical protein B0I36DRAFT_24669 [Microdochium trichocladiopsis]